jgi:hypothetical protein
VSKRIPTPVRLQRSALVFNNFNNLLSALQPPHTVGCGRAGSLRQSYPHIHTAPAADILLFIGYLLDKAQVARPCGIHASRRRRRPAAWSPKRSPGCPNTLTIRATRNLLSRMVCHRIVLDTLARDLSTFSWCKVLLSCVADAVEGARIVHFQASNAKRVFTRGAASMYSSRIPTP